MKGGPARRIHAAPYTTQNCTSSQSMQQLPKDQRSLSLLPMERCQQAWEYTENEYDNIQSTLPIGFVRIG